MNSGAAKKQKLESISPHRLDTVAMLVDDQEKMFIEHDDFNQRCHHICESIKALAETDRPPTKADRPMSRSGQRVTSAAMLSARWISQVSLMSS